LAIIGSTPLGKNLNTSNPKCYKGDLESAFTLTAIRKFVPRDQQFPLNYSLLLLPKNNSLISSFVHKNSSGQILCVYFLLRNFESDVCRLSFARQARAELKSSQSHFKTGGRSIDALFKK